MAPEITPESGDVTEVQPPASPVLNVGPANPSPPTVWYAHRPIQHNGVTIEANGQPLPADFPLDSLKRLVSEKSVGTKPPGKTALIAAPGTPAVAT